LHRDRDSSKEKIGPTFTIFAAAARKSDSTALRKITAELLITPAFSVAIGWKKYDCDKTEYWPIFLIAAYSAGAPPASRIYI